jgi:formylglycine-generating enzyme required for sulfatase activity
MVTGGTFFRSYTNDGGGPANEADPATVSDFRLDKYPVTVGRFRQFVQAWNGGAGWTPAPGSGKHTYLNGGQGLVNSGASAVGFEPGWLASDDAQITPTDHNLACDAVPPGIAAVSYFTWTASPAGRENQPINCVNWWEAYAFCIWDGGFLPSEAELEYAAAGGNEERQYPWGTADPGTMSLYAIYECYYERSMLGWCWGVGNIAPVGTPSLGGGKWGQLDLVGNLRAWTLDEYATYTDPCVDCADMVPAVPPSRATRSCNFSDGAPRLYPTVRSAQQPGVNRRMEISFRCARAPNR